MSQMSIKDYQQTVDEWVKTYGVRYFSELTNLGILQEELGRLDEAETTDLITSMLSLPMRRSHFKELGPLWLRCQNWGGGGRVLVASDDSRTGTRG